MTSAVTITKAALAPQPIPLALDTDLRVWSNKLQPQGLGWVWATGFKLPASVRSRLEVRAAYLAQVLAPIGPTGAKAQLATLRNSGLSRPNLTDDEGGVAAVNMIRKLKELPPFALALAVDDFVTGKAGNGWVPSLPDLLGRVAHHSAPAVAERTKIRRVLDAPERKPRDPERVKANLAEAAEVMAEMKGAR